jgi:hypothetical protein
MSLPRLKEGGRVVRGILLVIGAVAISGCAAPQADRLSSPRSPARFSEPDWCRAQDGLAAGEWNADAPTVKLELVFFKLDSQEARENAERLGLASGAAVLTDEQFTDLLESARSGGAVTAWPGIEAYAGGAASLELGRTDGEQILRGTAWHMRTCNVTADSADVQFAVQIIADENNWFVEDFQQLQLGEAVAHLVAAGDQERPQQGLAVRLASIYP